jgi:hypothetical protein
MTTETVIGDDLAQRVANLLREFGHADFDPHAFALAARRHNIALVDPDRHRCLVDETVYHGALYRLKHWQGLADQRAPVPMILFCPHCGERHVDKPEPEHGWTNPPHRTHYCHACHSNWRPADIATVGVDTIATRGRLDAELPARAGGPAPHAADELSGEYEG